MAVFILTPPFNLMSNDIGQKMATAYSERKDVTYRFTVLDSPIVNAFALPGGYMSISRAVFWLDCQ
jgi:predicted Zn-dependent protease